MEREIALHTEQIQDKLLEIGTLVLAIAMIDEHGVVRPGFVFTPYAYRGSILVNDRAIHIEVVKDLDANFRKQFPCSVVMDAIQNTSNGIIVKHLRSHAISEKEWHIPHLEKLLYPVNRRPSTQNIHDKAQNYLAGTGVHAAVKGIINPFYKSHALCVFFHNRQMR